MLTYRDMIDRMLTFLDGGTASRSQQGVRRAIATAYREVGQSRYWSSKFRQQKLHCHGPYSTGSIQYEHTGHSSGARIATLSTGSWPSWIVDGDLRVGTSRYTVSRRLSSARVQLSSNVNPGENLSTGTAYEAVQTRVELPADYQAANELLVEERVGYGQYISPTNWLQHTSFNLSVGQPVAHTILPDPNRPNRMALFLYPASERKREIDTILYYRPRPLVYTGYGPTEFTGRVSMNAGETTVTGDRTAFKQGMVGSVLRISTGSELPSDAYGHNPAEIEATILEVIDDTTLVIDTASLETFTNRAFVISDPIDLDESVVTLFERCCEKQVAVSLNMDQRNQRQTQENYLRAYREACAADNRALQLRPFGDSGFRYRLADMPLDRSVD